MTKQPKKSANQDAFLAKIKLLHDAVAECMKRNFVEDEYEEVVRMLTARLDWEFMPSNFTRQKEDKSE